MQSRRLKRGLQMAGLLCVLAVIATACAGSTNPPRSSLPPGPVITDGVHPTDLAVSCSGDTASLIEIITDAGGEIVEQCSVVNLLRVRFPVASAPELLQVRDSLRSEGLDAVVILVLDPGDL